MSVPYSKPLDTLAEKAGLSKEEIEDKVKVKLDQLSGLITKEGAAHIIANELGVNLFEGAGMKYNIKDLTPGIKGIQLTGKITQVYEVREFNVRARTGKVGSFVLSDHTGSIRVAVWGKLTEKMHGMKPGDIVKIDAGYTRNNNGSLELHLNESSNIILNPEGVDVNTASVRKKIADVKEFDKAELFGTITQAFDLKFFEVCPQCGKRLKEHEQRWICTTHNEVVPLYSYVMNVILDDGAETIRVVAFRENVQRLLGLTDETIQGIREHPESFESYKKNLPGNQIIVEGRIKNNVMFGRLDMMAEKINTSPNPSVEISRLEDEMENTP